MKTAIFGGAFDPFHIEHRNLIIAVKEYLAADRVVIVPSYLPPHKRGLQTPYEFRREMVAAGTADLPFVLIDDIESESEGINPTAKTLPKLKEKYGDVFFLMGGDSVKNFHTWIEPQKVADTAVLALVKRDGFPTFDEDVNSLKKVYGARTEIIPYVGKKVSSSAIKATFEAGLPVTDLPDGVEEVIKKRGLYNNYADVVEKLKGDVSERTFRHCASTAIYAQTLDVPKVTFEEKFLACILHDCAKNTDIKMDGVPAPVVHQFVGAERARNYYGIENEDILSAIRYHTSGKPDMTALEKLAFSADMLEPNRNFEGVESLREIAEKDFEKGFRACVKATYAHLLERGGDIYPLTKECAEYYNNNN